ncbi:GNAT family N-acetyltransferase [bacterium]|jgi:[ribosomal protein S5]-alanine N-acetyltransferase|nr:GNAT family N-acetyltransferase [Verrucomicrobiota bacterium]MDA7632752.1 GNAT family N-acetyltransferase [bacterium]
MSSKDIVTPNLKLVIESLEGTHARINAMPDADKSELSPAWLALLDSAKEEDPWILGFNMVLRDENVIVGQCGFKGPPTPAGMVEIAYGVEPTKQGNGYATEAAEALTNFAFQNKEVRLVRAHTLPEANASTRVLTKCGFRHLGEVIDPDDGLVWRWERCREEA